MDWMSKSREPGNREYAYGRPHVPPGSGKGGPEHDIEFQRRSDMYF